MTSKKLKELLTTLPEPQSTELYLFIDPPSGWQYGFPKPMTKVDKGQSLEEALRAQSGSTIINFLQTNGYPCTHIDELHYIRYWIGPK